MPFVSQPDPPGCFLFRLGLRFDLWFGLGFLVKYSKVTGSGQELAGTCWKRQKLSRNLLELVVAWQYVHNRNPRGDIFHPHSFGAQGLCLAHPQTERKTHNHRFFRKVIANFDVGQFTDRIVRLYAAGPVREAVITLLVMSFKICQRRATRRRCACCEQTLRSTRQR